MKTETINGIEYQIGKLPVIGFFFRSQNSLRSRNELIILIRPYVFSTPAESAATSKALIEDLSIHPKIGCPAGTRRKMKSTIFRPISNVMPSSCLLM